MSVLPEARESLEYWERRSHTLPWLAVRQRREAREMAERWRSRVSEAERLEYGAGLLGAIFMVMAERRLPESHLKYAVGLLLTSFGVFFLAEGMDVEWPGGDVALLYVAGALALVSQLQVRRVA